MPYTSMPAWPTLTDQEVENLAYFITTFSPDFSNKENVPKPVELPSAPSSTSASIELGKKLYVETGCVKCHGNLGRGDGPSAPTLVDDLGHPIRAADLSQSWTLRGGSSREDIFRTMSTGLNGTPMASFVDVSDARATMGDHRLHRLALGERRAWLYQPRRRQVRSGSDRSEEWSQELRLRSCRALSDRRANHGARTRSSIRPRPASPFRRSTMRTPSPCSFDGTTGARRKRGRTDHRFPCRRKRRSKRLAHLRRELVRTPANPFGDAEVAPPAAGQAPQEAPRRTPLPKRTRASRPAIRVLRRRLDPDSFGGADGRPQALLHLRRRPELGGSLVLRSGPPRSPSVHRQGKRGYRAQRHGGSHRCRELRPGRMVGHLQAAPSPNLGRRVHARRVHADRLLGLGRVLARAWQQARSHGLVVSLRRARSGPIGRRPDGEDGARDSRHRAGNHRLGAVALRLSRPHGARR